MESTEIPKHLTDALTEYDRIADGIIKSFSKTIDLQETPEIIYHYTTDVGLKGILESGQLWLTDIFYLNDPSEVSHGVSYAFDILKSKAEQGPTESQIFAKLFGNFLQEGIQRCAHYFVCCFSSNGNDLGQWRAYADDGCGYALGFDTKGLEGSFATVDKVPAATFPVTYDDAELERIQRQLVENMFGLISLPFAENLTRSVINDYMHNLSVNLSVHVVQAALFFKHAAYDNEKEYRFMQLFRGDVPAPEVKRRLRRYELIKYREFNWRHLCPGALKRIVVGPAADRSKAHRFATDCLAAFHTGDIEIECSKIPYRVA